jgi:flagellar motor switch protein FliM
MSANRRPGNNHARSAARQGPTHPQLRKLQGIHEGFTKGLETALSTLLQTEMRAALSAVGLVGAGEFHKSLRSPDCMIALRLHPRAERMVLHIDSATALALLELLLGASEGPPPDPRALTEIEWSLLEEVVRVFLRPLGEAWQGIAEVEFEVESLGSDPEVIQLSETGGPLVRIAIELAWDTRQGVLIVAVPQEFFGGGAGRAELPPSSPEEVDRNLSLLEDASIELEVVLRGPTLPFEQLMALTPGQVVTFNYPLDQPVDASLNGAVWLDGHVVSAGKRRAFQVARLP